MDNPVRSYGGRLEREDDSILSFESFEEKIGYHFKDRSLLRQALTHRSFVNEAGSGREASNERLEFLGDAVLELAVSIRLYSERPHDPEGTMSKTRAALVCESALSKKAETLGIGRVLLLGKGEEKTGGRSKPSVTSDALEALIGAVYLDGGFQAAASLIDAYVLNDIGKSAQPDYKTRLQEYVQKNGGGTVQYRLSGESGPDHSKIFTMTAVIAGEECESGPGRSKKAAEQMAAKAALMRLEGQQEQVCF